MELPFDDDTFDAVVCQFGVMFFPVVEQGYREARRVPALGVWQKVPRCWWMRFFRNSLCANGC